MFKKTLALAVMAAFSALSAPAMAEGLESVKPLFEAKKTDDLFAAAKIDKGSMIQKGISISGPDIAENAIVVPLKIDVDPSIGATRVLLVADKNPTPLIAVFDAAQARGIIETRVRLKESGDVRAIAIGADGKVYGAAKNIKVTIGGCGG